MKQKYSLLFGSFDGIHPGHKYVLEQAKKYTMPIIVVVAQDSTILKIKGRLPKYSTKERVKHLKNLFPEAIITLGDVKQGTWSAIKKYKPGIILVGYDQHSLKNALLEIQPSFRFTIQQLEAYFPEKYKSSILN